MRAVKKHGCNSVPPEQRDRGENEKQFAIQRRTVGVPTALFWLYDSFPKVHVRISDPGRFSSSCVVDAAISKEGCLSRL